MLQRERLLLEIEARANGSAAFDDTEEQLNNLEKALGDTAKAADGFTEAGEGVRKESKAMANQIAGIEKTYQALADQINATNFGGVTSDIQDLAKAQQIAANSANKIAFDPSSIEVTTKAIQQQTSAVSSLASALKTTAVRAGMSADAAQKVAESYGQAAAASAEMNKGLEAQQEAQKGVGTSLASVGSAITRTVAEIHVMTDVLEALTDPARLKKIANILHIFEALARVRGYDSLADKLGQASDVIGEMGLKVHEFFLDSDAGFQKLADRAELLNTAFSVVNNAIKALIIAGTGFVALGLFRTFQQLDISAMNSAASMSSFFSSSTAGAQQVNILQRAMLTLSYGLDLAKAKFSGLFKAAASGNLAPEIQATVKATTASLSEMGIGLSFVKKSFIEMGMEVAKTDFGTLFSRGLAAISGAASAAVQSLKVLSAQGGGLSQMAALIGSAFNSGFGLASEEVMTFTKAAGGLAATIGKSVTPSLLLMVEAGNALSPGIFALGNAAFQSESKIIKLAGAFAMLAAIMAGGFAAAAIFVMNALGNLAITIGHHLSDAMERFEEKSREFAHTMNAFTFTVQGFADAIGVAGVGSVEAWTEQMDKLNETTAFTRHAIAESVKQLVAEGSSIGISFTQNAQLLARAADVAAAHGRDLGEVTNGIVKGLVGQGQMLQTMGIDLSEASLAHSKYVQQLGKGITEMNQHELVQARLNVLLEKTAPILGAAANETKSLAGANMVLNKSLDNIQVKLGQQGYLSMAITGALTDMATTFLKLPDPILVFLGTLQDVSSVALIAIGYFLKYTLLISSLTGLYTLLSRAIAANAIVQLFLNTVLGSVATAMGLEIAAIKSLSTALVALRVIVAGGLIAALKAFGTMILATAGRVWTLTAALLANPLFWAGAGIIVGIMAIVVAFKEMTAELQALEAAANHGGDSMKKLDEGARGSMIVMQAFSGIVSGVWRIIKDLAKFLVGGWVAAIIEANMAFIAFSRSMTNNPEKVAALTKELDELRVRLGYIAQFLKNTGTDIAKPFKLTAEAAEDVGESVARATDKLKEFQKVNERLNKLAAEAFDPDNLKASILGDEFQKAAITYDSASQKYNKALNEYQNNGEKTAEKEQEVVKLRMEAAQSYLSMLKTQQDATKKYSDQASQQREQELKDQGRLVDAATMAAAARIKEFDSQTKSLKANIGLTKQQAQAIKNAREQLEKYNTAEVTKAQKEQDTKFQQHAIDQYDELAKAAREARTDIAKGAMTSLRLIDFERDQNIARIKLIEEELRATNALTASRKAGLEDAIRLENERAGIKKDKVAGGSPMAEGIVNATEGLGQVMTAGSSAMMGVLGAVNTVLDVIISILKIIPTILEKAAQVVDLITNFVPTVAKGFKKLGQAMTGFFKNFLKNIGSGVESIMSTIFDEILGNMVNAIADLMANGIAKEFERAVDQMPAQLEKFAKNFVTFMPKLMIGFIKMLTQGMPRIIKAFIKAVPLIVKAVYRGIVEGLKEVWQMIKSIFTGAKMDFGIEEQAKKLVDSLGKGASELFKVIDEDAIARGRDQATKVAKAIDDAIWRLWDLFKKLAMAIWEGLKKLAGEIWDWFKDKGGAIWEGLKEKAGELLAWFKEKGGAIWEGFKAAAASIWDWLKEKGGGLWEGFKAAVLNAWDWIKAIGSNIGSGIWAKIVELWDEITGVGRAIASGIWNKIVELWESFKSIGSTIGSGIWNKIVDLWESFKSVGTHIGSGLWSKIHDLWEDFKNLGSNIAVGLWNKIITFDWGKLVGGGGGGGPQTWFGNTGGMPLYAAGGHWQPKGVDVIPAMYQPGEFIVSKKGVDNVGVDMLRAINSGMNPMEGSGSGTTVQVTNHFDIKTTQPVDAAFIDKEIVPRTIAGIRKASIGGKRIVSPKGVQK